MRMPKVLKMSSALIANQVELELVYLSDVLGNPLGARFLDEVEGEKVYLTSVRENGQGMNSLRRQMYHVLPWRSVVRIMTCHISRAILRDVDWTILAATRHNAPKAV